MTVDRRTDVRYYLRSLARHKWLIALVALLLGGTGLGSSLMQDEVYRASSQLLIGSSSSRSLFDPARGEPIPDRALQTQIGVLKSPAIRIAVQKEIPNAPAVTAAAAGQTDIVIVTAESNDPQLAARTADAYASAYIDYRRRQSVDSMLAAGREIQKKIDALEAEITDINSQLDTARKNPEDVLNGSLTARRDSLIAQQALFRQRLDQLQVDASLQDTQAELVGQAAVPTYPVRPTPVRTTVLAVIGGLLAGGALALLRERLDETLKTKDDIEQAIPGLPLLAQVPAGGRRSDRHPTQPVAATDPGSPRGEAYRALRTAIQFMAVNRDLSVIQITSPDAGEGKSTIVANLAVAMARNGKRVVVVCCDLRRPSIHECFGVDNATGFTSVLLNEVTLPDALRVVPGDAHIVLLPAGPSPPNPSELLAAPATTRIFAQLKLRIGCDFILVDTPPILPVTDAAIISGYVDATIVVAAAGETTQPRLREAVDRLRQVNAPLLGVVLNGVTAPDHNHGSYGYEPAAGGVSPPKARWRRIIPAARKRPRTNLPKLGDAPE